jgi:hypothetical protein
MDALDVGTSIIKTALTRNPAVRVIGLSSDPDRRDEMREKHKYNRVAHHDSANEATLTQLKLLAKR